MDAERRLTIAAVGRGARLHPGHFWDLPGSFLFTIYVMTALGFGAPVPQTLWGRTYTLVYAAVAVPMHIYLMVHLSTFIVVKVEHCVDRLASTCNERITFVTGKKESPTCSRNSELMKTNKNLLRRKIMRFLSVVCLGRGIPLATLLYYLLGAAAFGLAREKRPLEVVMFPLEFTTGGGLEHVECYVRLLYALYVEGAMILLSCALATIRRHSSNAVYKTAEEYRLFTGDI